MIRFHIILLQDGTNHRLEDKIITTYDKWQKQKDKFELRGGGESTQWILRGMEDWRMSFRTGCW